MKDPKKGFTLIELLVVISIISLLSSIVLASLTEVRKKARDTKRVAEVQQIQTQLELYYNENGAYPIRNWTSSNDSVHGARSVKPLTWSYLSTL